MMTWLLCIAAAYAIGSIPFGVLIARSRGVDIAQHGSGNIGATNVGRVLGRRFGILCFVLDAAKGAGPVIGAGLLTGTWGHTLVDDAAPLTASESMLWLAVAIAALLGHMYSPWIGFRGGKGVATGFGGMLAMWPMLTIPAALALLVWIAVVKTTRYVSLASMSAASTIPVVCAGAAVLAGARNGTSLGAALAAQSPVLGVTALLAAFVIYKHRGNIARLRAGTENRVGR